MPNWCENDLFVTGDNYLIFSFLRQAQNPEHLQLLDFYNFLSDRNAWNTKWNACNVVIRHNYETAPWNYIDDGFLIKFETAWSPPTPVILAMSKQFRALKFVLRYYEMGEGFKGRFACKGGKVICDRREEYLGNRGG